MNEELIRDFSLSLLSEGISEARIKKYQSTLHTISKNMKKSFEKCGRDEIVDFLAKIEKDDYTANTKKDFRVVIKRFWKWMRKTDDYPPDVNWIKTTIPRRLQKIIRTKDILTEQEVYEMVDTAPYIRDKAIISMLFETGSRIGEIEKLNIGDIVFDDKGYNFVSNGKTGDVYKRVVNTKAVELLKSWMNMHPMKGDSDSPLWVTLARSRVGTRRLENSGMRKMLKEVAEMCKITKKVNPHAFRHARITDLRVNRKVPDAIIEMMVGWTPGSRMFDVYQHAKSEDVDKALSESYGLKEEQKKRKMIQTFDNMLATDSGFRSKIAKLLQEKGVKA
jgi:integrase/recombinase XerD